MSLIHLYGPYLILKNHLISSASPTLVPAHTGFLLLPSARLIIANAFSPTLSCSRFHWLELDASSAGWWQFYSG